LKCQPISGHLPSHELVVSTRLLSERSSAGIMMPLLAGFSKSPRPLACGCGNLSRTYSWVSL
jgi:hypothetical protein